mmetsp:Transcript_15361/g.42613  ORF Transcript_15361/g.42613 Transcript_15361/m.42613 type:complete len:96 (-) Transcript_15361:289-576(-)
MGESSSTTSIYSHHNSDSSLSRLVHRQHITVDILQGIAHVVWAMLESHNGKSEVKTAFFVCRLWLVKRHHCTEYQPHSKEENSVTKWYYSFLLSS